MRKPRRMLIVVLTILVILPGCLPRSLSLRSGAGAGDESHPKTVPAVAYSENGACPVEYPFCLSAQGFDVFEASVDDLRACEGSLENCQRDLDGIPREVEVVIEEHVISETPWWNWVLIGGLVALIPVGVGVGWYMGSR
jgi:hypothetical protein